ncbi:radical SAM protein [Streptomyces sp. NBC_00572]|uniref:radical SAM protein n=1 Tax=Streptomyces sp. NBC_00572 TaxID=2903664 RepID=UPI00224EE2FB|nr:radical SAM protein [Streptomyces sp. NBC_00572]MCX4986913.1 radical SAM protein [Streptomyces sp. NBC_00572]
MTARPILSGEQAASCYFRTTVDHPNRKALVQICEPCNALCAHCFVTATKRGNYMPLEQIRERLIPQLAEARVTRVTLTGGEPFMHEDLIAIIRSFRDAGMAVGVCTNGTMCSDEQIRALVELDAHMNVSLDGFAEESHSVFRGLPGCFGETIGTIKRFATAGILQGLLCTPNNLAEDEEYRKLVEFAREQGAKYVLMNPLGSMGRGASKSAQGKLRTPDEQMTEIAAMTAPFEGDVEMVNIRFPNADKPLSNCEAGTIIYVFTDGGVAICPYLVFAARTRASQHPDTDFLVGNVWTDDDVAARLDAYGKFSDRWDLGGNSTCRSCSLSASCGKGCPAAVVAAGERIGAVDSEQCPVVPRQSRVLPVVGVS